MVQKKRNIKLTPRYRKQPDVRRLSRALLALAEAEAERAAQAAHEADKPAEQAS
jgi:hypothetical protein